jgi:hypothetical protein
MGLIMDVPFTEGQVATWAYDDQGPCDLQEVRSPNTEADNQTYAVNNMIYTPAISEDFVGACDDPLHEMFLQLKGVGTPVTSHTADIYQPDHTGVFNKFQADLPVWRGGRLANGSVYSTDAQGNPIATALHYQNVVTNEIKYSRDLTNWLATNCNIVYNQVGITGKPNTASLVTSVGDGTVPQLIANHPTLDDQAINTVVFYFKKKSANPMYSVKSRIEYRASGSRVDTLEIIVNAYSLISSIGYSFGEGANGRYTVINKGDFFAILIEMKKSIGIANIVVEIRNTDNNNVQAEHIVGNTELYLNKTIDEVENIGPIFTDGTVVSTDRINYAYNVANLNNDSGAVYMEVNPAPGLIAGTFLSYGLGPELIADPQFSGACAAEWKCYGDWVVGNGTAYHPAGSPNSIRPLPLVTPAAMDSYQIRYQPEGVTSGVSDHISCKIGGNLGSVNSGNYMQTDVITTGDTTVLAFVPTSGWDGYLQNASCRKIADSTNFILTDSELNSVSVPGIIDQVNKVGVRWNSTDSLMSIMVNGVWSADVPYSGNISDDFKMFTAMEGSASVHCIRAWGGGHYADLKQAIENQFASGSSMASAFDAGFDSGFK